MTKLNWDQIGERYFETGLDRGVLYLRDGRAVPWNGLTGVSEELGDATSTPSYIDGIKRADVQVIGDLTAMLGAFTYPDEFLEVEGYSEIADGLYADEQDSKTFNLSYRTRVGNDLDSTDHGYRIHILYNLTAMPSAVSRRSISSTATPDLFNWTISGIPEDAPGNVPTAHIIFDSRRMNRFLLRELEGILYGTDESDPYVPPLSELMEFSSEWVTIHITDNGDGTWTATGPDELITMLDETTFQITEINATYLDPNTYIATSS